MHHLLNEENETALYRQCLVIYRFPLRQVWVYLVEKQQFCIFQVKVFSKGPPNDVWRLSEKLFLLWANV